MDYNQIDQQSHWYGKSLANAAMILGIGALLTAFMMTLYLPFIFGSLAIVFALLSKGRAGKMASLAKTGACCAILGLVINVCIFVSSIYYVLSNPSILLDTARQYDSIYENVYGVTSEELFGDSLENMTERIFGIE